MLLQFIQTKTLFSRGFDKPSDIFALGHCVFIIWDMEEKKTFKLNENYVFTVQDSL